jgi:hypothetical protein
VAFHGFSVREEDLCLLQGHLSRWTAVVLQHLESGVFSDVRRTRRGVSKVRRLQWKYALELYGLVPTSERTHRYQDAKDASAKAHAVQLGAGGPKKGERRLRRRSEEAQSAASSRRKPPR